MPRSVEYPATIAGVKRGLKAIGYPQSRAARETEQSPALVSMVLAKKVKSQPCLNRLATLIAGCLTPAEPALAGNGRRA